MSDEAQAFEERLSREQLNQLATDRGLADPTTHPNKAAVAKALVENGVTSADVDAFLGEGDDNTGSDPKSVAANKQAQEDNPANNPASAEDLNTLHEPGSVRDGSAVNEDVTPKEEEHPDINADPGGRQETAGNGERLDDSSNNDSTPEQTAKAGQETAERNGAEEAELNRAALDSGTSRESSTLEDQANEGWATARRNVASERRSERVAREAATTSTPVDNSSK
jgi:hypothetical protein